MKPRRRYQNQNRADLTEPRIFLPRFFGVEQGANCNLCVVHSSSSAPFAAVPLAKKAWTDSNRLSSRLSQASACRHAVAGSGKASNGKSHCMFFGQGAPEKPNRNPDKLFCPSARVGVGHCDERYDRCHCRTDVKLFFCNRVLRNGW